MKTRRKLEKRNIRKITKGAGGSSYYVTLPIDLWRWKERQKVVLEVNEKDKTITIKDWKK